MIVENASPDNFIADIDSLSKEFKLSSLLKRANFRKREGFGASVYTIFRMTLHSCFFRGNKTVHGNYTSLKQSNNHTSKSSLYRFLSEPRHNWRKLMLLFTSVVIARIRKLYDKGKRKFCFIVDDSILERPKAKKVELLARLYDHVFHRYVKGFNCLQPGWSDGCSYIPVANALMSSSKSKNGYHDANDELDHRTCGCRARKEA